MLPDILNPEDERIPPASESWPEWGLYNALLNGIVYLVEVFNVGVKSLLNFKVVILDVIAESVLSIKLLKGEYLKAASNLLKLFVLKSVIVFVTLDINVSCALIVFLELYEKLTFNLIFVYSGSTISVLQMRLYNYFLSF